ncbi:hypothetical protein EVAR_73662_1 [Eumeta japonica]|uniref:Uncharacterized protein n=1 Tax=Eumeta variegata TaxID=151549 RepID=A0A4C1TD53_EUMVA|nr:hypothetical protein EVAR_73662_1 [Eumeta japonica]
MTSAPLFKNAHMYIPSKNPSSTPLSMITSNYDEEEPLASTPTNNHLCRCSDQNTVNDNTAERCSVCGLPLRAVQSVAMEGSLVPVTLAIEGNTITPSMADSVPPLCK